MITTVSYEGNLRTLVPNFQSGTVVGTDAPVEYQGRGEYLSPMDLFAATLGSCMATMMGIKSQELNIDLRGMRISVEMTPVQNPLRIGSIHLQISFPPNLRLERNSEIILENTAKTCPLTFSVHPDIAIKTEFLWEEAIEV